MCVLLPKVKFYQPDFVDVSFSYSRMLGCYSKSSISSEQADNQQRIITQLARLSDNEDYGVSLWNALAIWSHILWIHMQTLRKYVGSHVAHVYVYCIM